MKYVISNITLNIETNFTPINTEKTAQNSISNYTWREANKSCSKVSPGTTTFPSFWFFLRKLMVSVEGREEGFGDLGSPELNLMLPSSSRKSRGGNSQKAGIHSPQFSHSPHRGMWGKARPLGLKLVLLLRSL